MIMIDTLCIILIDEKYFGFSFGVTNYIRAQKLLQCNMILINLLHDPKFINPIRFYQRKTIQFESEKKALHPFIYSDFEFVPYLT